MIQYSFRKDVLQRKTAFVSMLFLVILGIQLGNWQLRRAEYKENLANTITAKESLSPLSASEKRWSLNEAIYHQMVADGEWLTSDGVWLDNRPHPNGRDPKTGIATGFNLLMPLKIKVQQQDFIIWVNRGWAPRSFTQRDLVPQILEVNTTVRIKGVVLADAGKTYNIGEENNSTASDGKKLVQNLNIENLSNKLNLPFQPFVLRQESSKDSDGLDRNWPRMDSGASKHNAYALQWYALSLMTFLFWLFTGIRKQSKRLG